MSKSKNIKILLSGGGTGGHLFPAIAIADAIKEKIPHAEFLFVGALGKIEMEKVPQLGYEIKGLPITGFQRKLTARNLSFPFRLGFSLTKAFAIVRSFKPTVAIGTGGYASGPVLKAAEWMGIPTYLQEQNSYPGVTNRLLGKKAKRIFVAFDTLEKYFDKEKISITGNPLRKQMSQGNVSKLDAAAHFGMDANKPIVFITGGSLGARMLNRAVEESLPLWKQHDIQVIWQCGKMYFSDYSKHESTDVKVLGFVDKMDYAYAAASALITRAGASTISELALIAKPSILVPSPNVAEDHQTKNAMALVEKDAALMVRDNESEKLLGETLTNLLSNTNRMEALSAQLSTFALPNASGDIANQIIKDLDLI